MAQLLVVMACVACGSRSQHAVSGPVSQPPSAIAAVSADAARADGQLYRYGTRVTTGSDDRYTCRATDDAVRACSCKLLSPPMYWEREPHCSGIPTPHDPKADQQRLAALAVPACQCSCDASYKAASDAYQKRLEDCSRVP